jgi:hypothetical protein
VSNGASDFIGERKKMGVKTNHGLKFGKKKDGCIRFDRKKKKNVGWDKQWIRIL